VAALHRVLTTTDPFALSQRIDQHLERLWALANRASRVPRATPRAVTPWRGWTFSPSLQRQKQAMSRVRATAGGILQDGPPGVDAS
jgi:hypothetical protein